jgi:hypothetical protein
LKVLDWDAGRAAVVEARDTAIITFLICILVVAVVDDLALL